MSLLHYTGPPKIRATGAAEWLTLPLATFDNFVDGRRTFASRWKTMADRTQKRVGGAVTERAFRFGYQRGALSLDEAEALVAVLEAEDVELVPRSRRAADPDAGDVLLYRVRVTSEVPDTAHLAVGYGVDVVAESIAPPEPAYFFGGGTPFADSEDSLVSWPLGADGRYLVAYDTNQDSDLVELVYDGAVVATNGGAVGKGELVFDYAAAPGAPTALDVRVTRLEPPSNYSYTFYAPAPVPS